MNKITYLFGAGASANALPVVKQIPDKIKSLSHFLSKNENLLNKDEKFTFFNYYNVNKRDCQNDMINSLEWLYEVSRKHESVDTFAKKLYLRQDTENLKKLKIALSIFFIFEQAMNPVDSRYDSFLASILKDRYRFPDSLRVLSWNYDYQMEMAYSEFSEMNEITGNQNILNLVSKNNHRSKNEGFKFYKLNGSIKYHAERGWRVFDFTQKISTPVDLNFIENVALNFATVFYSKEIYSSLSFAWEPDNQDEDVILLASQDVSDTIALVVIGYSFPFFNRDVDRQIIGSMKNLKRVYFQSPDAENLKERFQALKDDLKGIELVTKFDCNQFLLPNEM
jgi:hypothetical protein